MLVTVQSDTSSNVFAFSDADYRSGWILDENGCRLAFVETVNKEWCATFENGVKLCGSKHLTDDKLIISNNRTTIFSVRCEDGERTVICRPSVDGDKQNFIIGLSENVELSIGRSPNNIIVYESQFVSEHHAVLILKDGAFALVDRHSSNGVFVNGKRIESEVFYDLAFGDVVSVLGLHITIGKEFISLNNPQNDVHIQKRSGFVEYQIPSVDSKKHTGSFEKQFFYPALRFARSIERKSFNVDAPPQQEQRDDTPIAIRIGPSLAMALASILSASISVMYMMDSSGSTLRAIPMVAMAIAMLLGSVVWPILNKRYQDKKYRQKESLRRSSYAQYLSKVRSDLQEEAKLQKDILCENRILAQRCIDSARNRDSLLMSRTSLHKDYLELRVGRAELPLDADIRFPDQHFSMIEDDLCNVVESFSREPHVLEDVPLGYSLIEQSVLGLVGLKRETDSLLRILLVQIVSLHTYADVKIVMFCDEPDREQWRFVSYLPHNFNNMMNIRFFATSLEDANAIGVCLEKDLELRREINNFDAREAKPYYVVLCPSKNIYDKAEIVSKILEQKSNMGFSLIACAEEMHELPRHCRTIIGIEGERGYLLDRDDPTGTHKPIVFDAPLRLDEAEEFARLVARVQLDLAEGHQELPDRLGFLEMFGVGATEHLNISARWRDDNASDTLAACIGLDALGEPFMLNLHEDFHGPHGLIAGTTGSGKSEFIITYILSMAINYSPDDVAFVLIDYKGGGLAKAFDNERYRLPHVAGVITNLDGAAITRSLVSIKSELKRRQQLFNKTREVVGGDNVDIYKYLNLYRQGRVSEPCPHLIIVADEFAELKQQEPDFMDELISAARIGRSLGVHLILATQKPSGVVNDQIWSNSRFKICLKVSDAADSKEVIRCPDAAEITQAGRFYLMVGYNEYFAQGQSGYSGIPYNPKKELDQNKSEAVDYISDSGRVLLSVKPHNSVNSTSDKSEIIAVLESLIETAARQGKKARQLWLPPIPEYLLLDEVIQEYGYQAEDTFVLNPVVGVFDNPVAQEQGILTLPLTDGGNTVIYGTPDAGVELVLQAMLFSLITTHSTQSLNIYILDFGSQSLASFAAAPQVGDVVLMDDEEKVRRFFDFMSSIIVERRKKFAVFGGSHSRYCKSYDDYPSVLVVLNGISAFLELYDKYEEDLISFARESSQVGIRIVLTGESYSSVRMRLRNNFRQVLACDLSDPGDYASLFGSMRNLPQPRGYGRGLVQMEAGIFEFQAVHVCDEDVSDYEYISMRCNKLAAESVLHAPPIPVPPERVSAEMLAQFYSKVSSSCVPYGIYDDTLNVACFDFDEAPLKRVVFQKRRDGSKFMQAFIDSVLAADSDWDVAILDLAEMLDSQPRGCAMATRQNDYATSYLQGIVRNYRDSYVYDNERCLLVIMTGIMNYLNQLDSEFADELRGFLQNMKGSEKIGCLLFDLASDSSYTYEDWFKSHLTNKDGLWVGPGIDGQTSINTVYNARFLSDAQMDEKLAYVVEGGIPRLVHIVSESEKEKED